MTKQKLELFEDFLSKLEENLRKHLRDILDDYHKYVEVRGCAEGLLAVNKLICDIQDADASEVEHVGELCSERGLDWLLFDMFEEGCNLGYIKELMEKKLSTKLGKEIIQELKEIYK